MEKKGITGTRELFSSSSSGSSSPVSSSSAEKRIPCISDCISSSGSPFSSSLATFSMSLSVIPSFSIMSVTGLMPSSLAHWRHSPSSVVLPFSSRVTKITATFFLHLEHSGIFILHSSISPCGVSLAAYAAPHGSPVWSYDQSSFYEPGRRKRFPSASPGHRTHCPVKKSFQSRPAGQQTVDQAANVTLLHALQ